MKRLCAPEINPAKVGKSALLRSTFDKLLPETLDNLADFVTRMGKSPAQLCAPALLEKTIHF